MIKPLIIGNWKMNHGRQEALHFATRFCEQNKIKKGVDVALAPSFLSLSVVKEALKDLPVLIGGQNCHWMDQGAFTGEVSPVFLKEAGCHFVLLGHSERRHLFLENSLDIGKKVSAVMHHHMTAVLCIGEKEAERDANQTFTVLKNQLEQGLSGVVSPLLLVIAYEPVWAIGTGKNATPEQVVEVHAFLRAEMIAKFGKEVGEKIRILYGGSVNTSNAKSLLACPHVNGLLIGGASLKIDSFLQIIDDAPPFERN